MNTSMDTFKTVLDTSLGPFSEPESDQKSFL